MLGQDFILEKSPWIHGCNIHDHSEWIKAKERPKFISIWDEMNKFRRYAESLWPYPSKKPKYIQRRLDSDFESAWNSAWNDVYYMRESYPVTF